MKFSKKSAYGCLSIILLILIVVFISQEKLFTSKADEKDINLGVQLEEKEENRLENEEENKNTDEEIVDNSQELERLLNIKMIL